MLVVPPFGVLVLTTGSVTVGGDDKAVGTPKRDRFRLTQTRSSHPYGSDAEDALVITGGLELEVVGLPNRETLRLRQTRSLHPYGKVEGDKVVPGGVAVPGVGELGMPLLLNVVEPKSATERLTHAKSVQL